jgi:hypothetical protein
MTQDLTARGQLMAILSSAAIPFIRRVEASPDSSVITALLAIENRCANGVYDLIDGDVEDPESRTGGLLGAACARLCETDLGI